MHTAHNQALAAKHATLDRRLHDEASRPAPDAALIASLKKEKLRLKESIAAQH